PPQGVKDSFNRLMTGFYQDLKQFIVLHYCLSNRDDSDFWRNAQATVEHCDWLKSQLDVWQHKICEFQDLAGAFSTGFTDENYRFILYGMQHYPKLQMNLSATESQQIYDQLARMSENALQNTLPHINYLKQLNL
ncbi:MAG: tryptophan 7-halogenase, partial [Kordiimonas sp.]